jgi:hypothetical protein
MVLSKLQLFSTRYLYQREGVFYFQRDVPVDLRHHYPNKKVAFSLRTRSPSLAQRGAASIATKLDADWFSLRVNSIANADINQSVVGRDNSPSMADALQIYLHLKAGKKPHAFTTGATRNVDYLIEVVGNKPLTSYTTIDAGKFRERSDVVLDGPIPHIIIRPNGCRSLKTRASERKVPLVGASLWGATQALSAPIRSGEAFLFPRYTKGGKCNANSASAALNKWLKSHVEDGYVIHSFRHSMRDRLRAVECPSDIVDQTGGWSRSSAGESYGSGYPLPILHKWLQMIE